jgi:tRNA dimethylallyltransferase
MNDNNKPRLLVLVGPTAVGKTALSLDIAERFGCEIISGDSMQVYRGMDIGTAKATAEERARVRHHLIDIRDPDEPYSVADFQREAETAIRDIHARGKLPFIVGGTGLYIESVCYAYDFHEGGRDPAYRDRMLDFAREFGNEALHRKLADVDPAAAARLHPNDLRRVIRALEVYEQTGSTLTEQLARQTRESPYRLCMIGLAMDRDRLYARIEERVDGMIRQGLVDEVKRLMERGFDESMTAMQGLGYKEIVAHLRGEMTLAEATELLKRNTRRFAKRQLSWFRHMDGIRWVDVTDVQKKSEHLQTISAIIAGKFCNAGEYSMNNAK